MAAPLPPPDFRHWPAEPKLGVRPRPTAPLEEMTKTFPPEGVATWKADPGPPVPFLRTTRPAFDARFHVRLIWLPLMSVGAAAARPTKRASARALAAVQRGVSVRGIRRQVTPICG